MKRPEKNKLFFMIVATFLFTAGNIFAAGGEGDDTATTIMIFVSVLVILLSLWLIVVYSEANDNEGHILFAPVRKMIDMISGATPIENENEILLDHEYDGIKELDNKIPPWFHALFYGTILFGVIYMVNYHVIGSGNIQEEEYLAEISLANEQRQFLEASGALITEETVKFTDDAASLSSGKEIYDKNCASCHGLAGEGLVGPNLTDEYWIHGGSVKDLFKTVKYGVQAKGMISWQSQLAPKQMQEVSSYILSLQGTNPPNGKAPEGEKYVPEQNEPEEKS